MNNPLKRLLFNWRYANKTEHNQQIGDIILKFSTKDAYSKSWFYPRYDNGNIHEPAVSKLLFQALKPTDCFFDVGTNLGYFTCLAAHICETQVHAFEMDSNCIPLLETNLKMNHLENVVINNVAVSDKVGVEKIPSLAQPNAGLQIVKESNSAAVLEVKSITLDEYVEKNNLNPTFLKIDVEGAEMKVLSGMKNLLQKDLRLLIEIHPKNLLDFNASYQKVIAILLENNYSIEEITAHRIDKQAVQRKKIDINSIIENNTMLFAWKA